MTKRRTGERAAIITKDGHLDRNPEWHFLPDGQMTRSERRYVREWRAFARPLAKALGGRLASFDPSITICIPRQEGYDRSVQFDRFTVAKLNAALERGERG